MIYEDDEPPFFFFFCFFTLDNSEEVTIEPRAAIEGDDVTLTCRATRYLYTDLRWMDSRNQTVTVNVSNLQISHYSISLSLYLHNVSRNSTAGYKCLAYKLRQWEKIKTAKLVVNGKLTGLPRRSSVFLTV